MRQLWLNALLIWLAAWAGQAYAQQPMEKTEVEQKVELLQPSIPGDGTSTTPELTSTVASMAQSPTSTITLEAQELGTSWQQQGVASWYGPRFHGRRTASGEIFNTRQLTAAHRSLPFGSRVRVTSQLNGKQVIVRINDRGPYIKGRIIDLSRAAAQAIGLSGVKEVRLELLPLN